MKRFIMLLAGLLLCATLCFGQKPIEFLGIPVSGTKQGMIEALKKKGFVYHESKDYLEGIFNGEPVQIVMGTIGNNVFGIAAVPKYLKDDIDAITKYNSLYIQFMHSPKYVKEYGEMLEEDEKVYFNLCMKYKEYSMRFSPSNEEYTGFVEVTISLDKVNKVEYGISIKYINPHVDIDVSDL